MAHLPLVAPHHARVIAHKEGTAYALGRREEVTSLVVPVPDVDHLLEAELRAQPFAAKIAWDIAARRRGKLHATLCGPPIMLDEGRREALADIGPITVELRGLFSGNVNLGRLYLRLYPEKRGGKDLLAQVQRILGKRETGLYLVGLHNLTDDLDVAEAAALAALIERWWERPILRWQVDALSLLVASDHLVLDSRVAEAIPLCRAG